jgi:hypothetical protein
VREIKEVKPPRPDLTDVNYVSVIEIMITMLFRAPWLKEGGRNGERADLAEEG